MFSLNNTVNPVTMELIFCLYCSRVCDKYGVSIVFGRTIQRGSLHVHEFCLKFSVAKKIYGEYTEETIMDAYNECIRPCMYCRGFGATVHCNHIGCENYYHFGCGMESQSKFEFFDSHFSYCQEHNFAFPVPNMSQIFGQICFTTSCLCVCKKAIAPLFTIYLPCCGRWMHNRCLNIWIGKLGDLSFCPTCNNRFFFQEILRGNGVVIPNFKPALTVYYSTIVDRNEGRIHEYFNED